MQISDGKIIIVLAGLFMFGCKPQNPISQSNTLPPSSPGDTTAITDDDGFAPVDTSGLITDPPAIDTVPPPDDSVPVPQDSATRPNDTGAPVTIVSLTATPPVVPPSATAIIECKTNGGNGGKITYQWEADGAVGYLMPKDSICIFASPSCHSGPATVTVTVSNGVGVPVSKSVNLN